MHETDPRVEDRLRAALRAEADDLPFTMTLDRLERRQAERRRTARAVRSPDRSRPRPRWWSLLASRPTRW